MKLQQECVDCILGQAKRVASVIGADSNLTLAIEAKALEISQNFSFEQTPPQVATPLYEALSLLVNTEDLYKEAKREATLRARALMPHVQAKIDTARFPLLTAGKLAVAGNVIDLATHLVFDLETEVDRVLEIDFAIDHWDLLLDACAKAKSILYLADNAGEHVFDHLFIKRLKRSYPKLSIIYMTRGNAIINDVTLQEAQEEGIQDHATLLSSGVSTPGFVFDAASKEAQSLFLSSDIVIAKGMGNYETLTEESKRDVFHLFKVKCGVVSRTIGHDIGSLICLQR